MRKLAVLTSLAVLAVAPTRARATTWDDASPMMRVAYTAGAVVTNIVPITSAFIAPTCLQGYILCKLTFAGISLLSAAEQTVMGGSSDPAGTKATLERGFSGDWFITPSHIAGDSAPDVYPSVTVHDDAAGAGGFTPPPI